MATDFGSFLDELVGTSEWDIFEVSPEGDPSFWWWVHAMVAGDPTPRPELTECPQQRLRALMAGSPRIEAQGGTHHEI